MYETGEGSLDDVTIYAKNYTNHENYTTIRDNFTNNLIREENDITIIELSQTVDLSSYTPACMARTSDATTFDGNTAWVYGKRSYIYFQSFELFQQAGVEMVIN